MTEFRSGGPTNDATLVQKAAEHDRSPGFPPYAPVQEVHPELGLWDLYLPAELVQELDRQGAHGFEYEEADRYFRVRFLGRDNHANNRRALARRLAERSYRCLAYQAPSRSSGD